MKYFIMTVSVTIWLAVVHYQATHNFIRAQQRLTVQGTISSIPVQHEHSISFVFNSNIGRIKLSWFHSHQHLLLGQHWQLGVRLKPPHGYRNPGGFDFERYLLSQHIRAVGYVDAKGANKKLARTHSLRAQLLSTMQQRYANDEVNKNALDIILAVSLGASSLLTPEHRALFQQTGTSHLMAISGLHVGMVAMLMFMLASGVGRCYPSIFKHIAKQQIASIAAIAAAFSYSLLAGFSVSTQRSLIMLSVYFLTQYFFIKRSSSVALGLALVVCLIIDPLAIYATSFWLSFGAVFVLLFSLSARLGTPLWYQSWTQAQWVCSLGLIPLTAWYFHGISFTSIISNIIAIPVVSFIVVPSSLLALITIKFTVFSQLCVTVAAQTLHWLLLFLHYCAVGYCYYALHNPWELICASIAALLLLLPNGLRVKHLAVVMLLPLLMPLKKSIIPGHFSLTVLDVGQGLACVVRTTNHTVLFDTGPRFEQFDSGRQIVVPYCQFVGIKKFDTIVVSHADNDHSGGLGAIVRMMRHGGVYTSDIEALQAQVKLPLMQCDKHVHWQYDGVQFAFENDASQHFRKDNDNSCVLKITGLSKSTLLTGDIEKRAEKTLLARNIQSDVVVVPHHGSRTSSSAEFINAVHPKTAVFSYGFLNRFHHPNDQVVRRYQQAGARVINTVRQGAITLFL